MKFNYVEFHELKSKLEHYAELVDKQSSPGDERKYQVALVRKMGEILTDKKYDQDRECLLNSMAIYIHDLIAEEYERKDPDDKSKTTAVLNKVNPLAYLGEAENSVYYLGLKTALSMKDNIPLPEEKKAMMESLLKFFLDITYINGNPINGKNIENPFLALAKFDIKVLNESLGKKIKLLTNNHNEAKAIAAEKDRANRELEIHKAEKAHQKFIAEKEKQDLKAKKEAEAAEKKENNSYSKGFFGSLWASKETPIYAKSEEIKHRAPAPAPAPEVALIPAEGDETSEEMGASESEEASTNSIGL